jgi:hypothetical protein
LKNTSVLSMTPTKSRHASLVLKAEIGMSVAVWTACGPRHRAAHEEAVHLLRRQSMALGG